MRTAVSHPDADPGGVAELDDPVNHGWCKKTDTPGRWSGSSMKICRSNVINPSVSSTV